MSATSARTRSRRAAGPWATAEIASLSRSSISRHADGWALVAGPSPNARRPGLPTPGRFGLEVLDGIGSTELGHIFISSGPGRAKAGFTGTPVPGFRVRLLDETGHEVAPDAPASLWVSGPSAVYGYWQQEDKTAETFVDGWVRTGDTYQRSPPGDYRYVGRTDELFKVAGEWVPPYEVESVIW